jgi:cobalt-zinc-cadmium efflux system outer membrane protein
MFRFLLPLALAAAGLPCRGQTIYPDTSRTGQYPQSSTSVETAQPLTLTIALDRARTGNPTLSAAGRERDAQEGAVLQAGLRPNPYLDLNVLDTRRATRETIVQLSQPIELGDKRLLRITAAATARDGAAAEVEAAWLDLRAGVTRAFYDVLVEQERVALAGDAVTNARRAAGAAAKRVLAGKISPVEETRARVAEAAIWLELAQARSDLATARVRLASFWGDGAARFAAVSGSLDALPAAPALHLLQARLASSPALLRARIEVARRQALADVERSKRIPDIAFTVGMKRSEELGRNQAIVGLTMPLPLFDRNQGNVLDALRRTDKARDALSAAQLDLNAELVQAHATLETAREQALTLRDEILPGAQGAFEAASTGFEYGKFSFLDVLDAQRTLLHTRAQYLRALGDAHRAAADIARLVGDAPSP